MRCPAFAIQVRGEGDEGGHLPAVSQAAVVTQAAL